MRLIFTGLLLAVGVLTSPGADAEANGASPPPLVLTGATLLPFPGAQPIEDGTLVTQSGRITALGRAGEVALPLGATVLDCRADTVVAGFWNTHVHFTEPKWVNAAQLPADQLGRDLQQMLTRQGFTVAVDEGSILPNTIALRRRIEDGEVRGPRIFTAGIPLFPKDGIPWYVTESLPAEIVRQLYTPSTPDEAVRDVDADVAGGADLVKLFLVTGVRVNGKFLLRDMDVRIVQAATAEAHRLGKLVAVHPSNIDGVNLALAGPVDILGHTIQDPENWTPAVISRLAAAHISLIPTLTLFGPTGNFRQVVREVKAYADAGGQILFGTDIGFLTDYSSLSREFFYLGESGLSFSQILASLTTAPAARFGFAGKTGRLGVGAEADLVILRGLPGDGAHLLTQVRYTIRAGRVLYSAAPPPEAAGAR